MTKLLLPHDDFKLKFPLYYKYLDKFPEDQERYAEGYAKSKGKRRQYLDEMYRNSEALRRIADA